MTTIVEIADKKIWDSFIDDWRPNTFLHSWEWGEFNRQVGNIVFNLGVKEADELVGVALVIKIKAKRGSFLLCPHGPILADQNNIEPAVEALTDFLRSLAKKEGCGFVRVAPLFFDTPETQEAFKKLGYLNAPIHMHPELSWILDISKSEEELLKEMRKTTRHSIKKAEQSGVKIEVTNNFSYLPKFWRIYKETAMRHSFTPFSQKYLSEEFLVFNKVNNALIFSAHYKDKPIAVAMIIFNQYSAFYHHGASIALNQPINASHLLQWQAILEAKKRGCTKYNFWGIAPDNHPKHPWAGLTLFKKGFGGYGEQYLHTQDLPISSKYWVTYIVETIRRKWRRL